MRVPTCPLHGPARIARRRPSSHVVGAAPVQCREIRQSNLAQGSGAGLPDDRGPEDCTAGEIQQKLEIVESSTLASVGESIALLF
jgi:hypothetical protein